MKQINTLNSPRKSLTQGPRFNTDTPRLKNSEEDIFDEEFEIQTVTKNLLNEKNLSINLIKNLKEILNCTILTKDICIESFECNKKICSPKGRKSGNNFSQFKEQLTYNTSIDKRKSTINLQDTSRQTLGIADVQTYTQLLKLNKLQ